MSAFECNPHATPGFLNLMHEVEARFEQVPLHELGGAVQRHDIRYPGDIHSWAVLAGVIELEGESLDGAQLALAQRLGGTACARSYIEIPTSKEVLTIEYPEREPAAMLITRRLIAFPTPYNDVGAALFANMTRYVRATTFTRVLSIEWAHRLSQDPFADYPGLSAAA